MGVTSVSLGCHLRPGFCRQPAVWPLPAGKGLSKLRRRGTAQHRPVCAALESPGSSQASKRHWGIAISSLAAGVLMALTPPALAQQHTLDEFTQYQEMIKERTGGSLPTVQSYKSPVASRPSILSNPWEQLAMKERDLAQLSDKLERLQNSRGSHAIAQASSTPQQALVAVQPSLSETNEKTEESPDFLSLLGAGASLLLGGALLFSNQKKEEVEAELGEQLETQRKAVTGLREQLQEAAAAVDREHELVAKLQKEGTRAEAASQQKIELEQQEKTALDREKRSLTEALQAEKRLAEAAKSEAAAINEALEAEKAAKYAADSEVKTLQSKLNDTNAALQLQRELAQKIGETAAQAKAELSDSKRRSTQFMLEASSLQDSLVSEQNKRSEAESKVSLMTHELDEAADEIRAKSADAQEAQKENLSMKEAMKLLKEDSARIACALQEKAREATAVREKAELNLKNASSKLEAERKEVVSLRSSLEGAESTIAEGQKRVSQLEDEIMTVKNEAQHLQEQLAALEFQVEATEKLLANEKSNVSSVEQANKNLLEELADVKQELEVVSKDREAGSAESARLQSELEELKSEYIDAGDRLKEEQNGMMAIRKQTQILSRQIQELRDAKKGADSRASALEAELVTTKSALQQAERKATEEQSNREESLKAVAELQEVVQGVRAESAAAQKSAEAARAKLMSEQSAREQAEKQAKNLMVELQSMTAAVAEPSKAVAMPPLRRPPGKSGS